MLGWLWRIIVGRFKSCNHEWKQIRESEEYKHGHQIGFIYIIECKKCGEIKQRRVGI